MDLRDISNEDKTARLFKNLRLEIVHVIHHRWPSEIFSMKTIRQGYIYHGWPLLSWSLIFVLTIALLRKLLRNVKLRIWPTLWPQLPFFQTGSKFSTYQVSSLSDQSFSFFTDKPKNYTKIFDCFDKEKHFAKKLGDYASSKKGLNIIEWKMARSNVLLPDTFCKPRFP